MKVYIKAITTIDGTEAEDGICGMFRRRRSPCPSEASNLAPSLVSPPPPSVWPKVEVTVIVMKQHSFRNRFPNSHPASVERTLRWAAVPCRFWLPWSGQRWHRPRRSTARWGAAARREPAQPGRNSPSTPAGAPQLEPCGSIWGNMSKVAI